MQAGVTSFLEEHRIAVVGVSRTAGFANTAMKELRTAGYEVFPVNVVADVVHGEPCFHSVLQVPRPLGAVLCVVPPEQAEHVVDDCARAGIRKLWLQPGSESPAVLRKAAAAGIDAVHGSCILMYARPRGIHRFHAFVQRVCGRL